MSMTRRNISSITCTYTYIHNYTYVEFIMRNMVEHVARIITRVVISLAMFSIRIDNINSYYTHTQPFYGSVEFVRENPGEPVPEETFTHYSHRSHQLSLSAFSI